MKKLLLLALTSLNLLCLGTAVRIKLVARDGQCVMLMGESDEQTGAITTPFDFVNTFFQFADCEMVQVLRENKGPLWELRQEINLPDIDPAILRQAVQGVSPDSGFDINQLDQPTITHLINVYDLLIAPQGVIDVLINRSVELAIADPAHCPFGAITRLPDPVNDREIISALNHVVAARRHVDELFREFVLPSRPLRTIPSGYPGINYACQWSPADQGWDWNTSVYAPNNAGLLKKLLMLKIAHNHTARQELTLTEIKWLQPIYNQLPDDAQDWINSRTGTLRQGLAQRLWSRIFGR